MGLKGRDILKRILFYGGNAIITLIFVSPPPWMIAASLKPEAQIFSDMSTIRTLWPTTTAPGSYVEVFTRVNMVRFVLNSLFYVSVVVVLDLMISSVCGYALAKFDFPGKELLLIAVISLMVLPMGAIMLSLYGGVISLDWVNTWAGLIVPLVGKYFFVYMFRQFFLDIPDDLLEATAIDGCGPIKIFFAIVMPISGTVYATIFILDFVAHQNDFMWLMLVVIGEDMRTIQLAIQTLFGSKPIHYRATVASLTVSAIPMLLMLVLLQRYYVEDVASTDIKGQKRAGNRKELALERSLLHTFFPTFS